MQRGYTLFVGQLKVVYQATSEFMAIAVRDELAAHGIGSVQLLNEIPMHPGFTFEVRPWAEILVREHDLPQAREIVTGLELVMNGDATSTPYPPKLKFNTTALLGVVWISLLVIRGVLGILIPKYGLWQDHISPLWGLIIWTAPDAVLGILLIILNWRVLRKHVTVAIGGLLGLLVILAWLIINAIPWFIRTAISFGDFKNSDEVKT